MKSTSLSPYRASLGQEIERIQQRVGFLTQQIESLEHYLPETYQLLMHELDLQQRRLTQLQIQSFYQHQSYEQQIPPDDPGDQDQGHEPPDQPT